MRGTGVLTKASDTTLLPTLDDSLPTANESDWRFKILEYATSHFSRNIVTHAAALSRFMDDDRAASLLHSICYCRRRKGIDRPYVNELD